MRKNHCPVVALFVLLVILFFHPITISAQQVRCTGQVLDARGRPVSGAKVAAYEMQFDGIAGNFALHKAGETTTAEDGSFTFTSDPKPERSLFYQCYIVAAKQDLALGWIVWKMQEDVQSDIELGEPAKVEGVIVDEAGKPIVGAEVRANFHGALAAVDGKRSRVWVPGIAPLDELGAQTDSQGRFFFGNLPANQDVDLLVTAAGKAITYTQKSETREPAFKTGQTDVRVVLPDEARIEGRIVDPDTGKGIVGTQFAVVATSSGLFYYRFVHTTNADGSFSVGGLQTGKYLIRGEFPSVHVDVISGQCTSDVLIGVNRQKDELSTKQKNTERERELQIIFGMRILELPTGASDDLFKPNQSLSSGILVRRGHEFAGPLLKLTQENKDARLVSSPQLLTYVGREANISMGEKAYISGYELARDGSGELIPKKEILYASDYKIKGILKSNDRIHITLSASLQEPVFETRQFHKGYDYQVPLPGQYFSAEGITNNNEPLIVGCLRPDKPELFFIITPSCLLPEPEPESLLGKILPKFDNIQNIDNLNIIEGKPILICFFDMEQRPSRNCLMQLNKWAKELQEKNVSLVAIQTSKVDQSGLNEWIENQNISIPVGMIQNDEEKTRLNWGFKSLPWLILTDVEHIVRSEGFMLNELEEKIKP